MRRDSREAVYKILYAELFNPEQDAQFEQFIFDEQKLNEEDRAFANLLLAKIRENKDEINEIITSYAKGYNFSRIYSTDKCALTLAVCEIKYFDDIPPVVSVSEATGLARKYSTDTSADFVNGVLSGVINN